MDYIHTLPAEVVAYLCIFLDESDISCLFSTNSYYNDLFQKHKRYICRLRPLTIIRSMYVVNNREKLGISVYKYGKLVRVTEYINNDLTVALYFDNNNVIQRIYIWHKNIKDDRCEYQCITRTDVGYITQLYMPHKHPVDNATFIISSDGIMSRAILNLDNGNFADIPCNGDMTVNNGFKFTSDEGYIYIIYLVYYHKDIMTKFNIINDYNFE